MSLKHDEALRGLRIIRGAEPFHGVLRNAIKAMRALSQRATYTLVSAVADLGADGETGRAYEVIV